MKKLNMALIVVCATLAGVATAYADEVPTPVEKRDNGLGELGHYSTWHEPWLYATPADKQDSGLGELSTSILQRETWMRQYPAEKLDSGFRSLPLQREQSPIQRTDSPANEPSRAPVATKKSIDS